ncbi:hypothetical protein DFH09DRAFT_1500281 [Mycena vulgaris]|nr:hypothetical protein DFH09DRAFT_1500281 [Mycena vulgaris]
MRADARRVLPGVLAFQCRAVLLDGDNQPTIAALFLNYAENKIWFNAQPRGRDSADPTTGVRDVRKQLKEIELFRTWDASSSSLCRESVNVASLQIIQQHLARRDRAVQDTRHAAASRWQGIWQGRRWMIAIRKGRRKRRTVEGNETDQKSFIEIRLDDWGPQPLMTVRAWFAPGTRSSSKRSFLLTSRM